MTKSTMKIEHGAQVWRLSNGKLHKEDGPAVINEEYEEWWLNGELHREDGPAVIMKEYEEWWLNGKLHRENGPAVIRDGKEEYWLHGKKIDNQFQYWFLVGKLGLEKL